MDCPVCKTEGSVMNTGSFDDLDFYECTFCGRDVTHEIEEQRIQEMLNEEDEEFHLDAVSGIEGDDKSDPLPSLGRDQA